MKADISHENQNDTETTETDATEVESGEPAANQTEPSESSSSTFSKSNIDKIKAAKSGRSKTVTLEKSTRRTESGSDAESDDAAHAESGAAPGDGGSTGGTRRTGSGRRAAGIAVFAVVAIIAIAAAALAIVLGLQLKNRVDADNAGQEALRTAEGYAVALTSIDTRNLDKDFARVLDGATGEFKDMYASSSSQLRQLLVDNQATGKGTVVDAGIKSQSPNKVEVMLFVDQTVTNTASPDPRIDRSRIVMTMEKIDGRWLASKVELP
ncbi:hypothetical protein GDN83_02365 [Gordonia jinghuaiqii]|uniref:Mce-associated membrane protein n=1 Tax=Gordonia jinghuaiqii TaxID=2758710 RepID=A0A7D7LP58_9ACTN|nr:hypothetical protein [Gordonia jinghuaiqii]MCR5976611.1 hypothetical protein [Gordonia jinghuaiqii]QMS99799.1 hypothetical protein H1R19_12425 [Gordonia jinghuaiqii]